MGLKTNRIARIIIFYGLTVLILYFTNLILARGLGVNGTSRCSFVLSFLGFNAIGLLLSAMVALVFQKKHAGTVAGFFGNSPLKSSIMIAAPVVLLILFGSNLNPQINSHLNGAIVGVLVMFLCIASEVGWRGYLTEELKYIRSGLRSLLIGTLWFSTCLIIFIPYFSTDNPNLSVQKFPNLLAGISLIYCFILILTWFLDKAIKITKSVFVSAGLVASFYFLLINGITGNDLTNADWCILFMVSSLLEFIFIGTWRKPRPGSNTNYDNPISELTYTKTVRRRHRSRNGHITYTNKTFILSYNPTVKNTKKRVMAKFIDWGFYIIISLIFYGAIQREFLDNYEVSAVAFLLMIFMNPLSESFFGSTIGKSIFGFKVIDDYGHKPSLMTSYKRNFLSAVSIMPLMRFIPGGGGPVIDRHNRQCHTFVVASGAMPEIIEKLNRANEPAPVMAKQ